MTWIYDKDNCRLLKWAGVLCVFLIAACFLAGWMQGIQVRNSLFEWEQATASSLLEQGVPETVAASAFQNSRVTEDGRNLLEKMGHTEANTPLLFPASAAAVRRSWCVFLAAGTAFSALLMCVLILHFRHRDRELRHALHIVRQYTENCFDERLFQGGTGTQAHLFAAVDQLATALRAKGDIEYRAKEFLKDTISDISHQLKTPLAALNMYIEIISEEPESVHTVRNFADKAGRSLERMERLIYLLLRMMRLDAGSVVFEKRKIQFQDLAREASQDLFIKAQEEGKKILFRGDPDLVLVCDPAWMTEALGNLIKNGLDHTPSGGTVEIIWERSVSMTRIFVRDNGSGIPPEDIHHIFKRFYRSQQPSDTEGVGLGLPLAKAIIEGQGGIISVESTVGEGTLFTLVFS